MTITTASGSVIELVFPARAVTETVEVRYTAMTPMQRRPRSLQVAGPAFSLEVYVGGALVPHYTFATPFVATLTYSDGDVRERDEENLRLFLRDGRAWQDVAESCEPASRYEREPERNRVSVAVCHLTEFAYFAPAQYDYYLPFILVAAKR